MAAEDKLKGPAKGSISIKPLYDASKEAEDARKELANVDENDKIVRSGSDESAKATSASAIARANGKYAKLKGAAAYVEMKGSVRAQKETDLKKALKGM